MSKPFNRGVSTPFLSDLQTGLTAPILDACRAAGLDVRLREQCVTAYHAGRAVASIRWQRGSARVEVHHKYVGPGVLPGHSRAPGGAYVSAPVTPELGARFADDLGDLVRRAGGYVKHEERCEEQLLRDNAGGGPLVCLDRQVGIPGTRSYVDVVGTLDGERPRLVLVELKRDLDNRIQEVPAQVSRYVGFFSPGGDGLREDVARSLRRVAEQLGALGFRAPAPASIEPGMPVLGLVVLVRYNPRSELLGRAHELAAQLDHPVWLWIAADDQRLGVPPQSAWTRMGAH